MTQTRKKKVVLDAGKWCLVVQPLEHNGLRSSGVPEVAPNAPKSVVITTMPNYVSDYN